MRMRCVLICFVFILLNFIVIAHAGADDTAINTSINNTSKINNTVSGVVNEANETNETNGINETKIITLQKDVFFPKEVVLIETNFNPEKAELLTPILSYNLDFEEIDGKFVAEYNLTKKIVLGEYTVVVDGLTKKFVVDSYSIDASYNNSTIVGDVKTYFSHPKTLIFEIFRKDNKEKDRIVKDCVDIENNSFAIPITKLKLSPGKYIITLTCGNARKALEFEIEELSVKIISEDEYDIGEEVSVKILTFLGEELVNAQVNVKINGSVAYPIKVNKTYYLNFTALKDVEISVKAKFNGVEGDATKIIRVRKVFTIDAKPIVKGDNVSIIGSVLLNGKFTNATIRYVLNGQGSEIATNGKFKINFTNLCRSNYTLNLTAIKKVGSVTLKAFKQLNFTTLNLTKFNKTSKPEIIKSEIIETIKLKAVYFPGEVVRINLKYIPSELTITDPEGVKHILNLTKTQTGFVAEYPLLKGVILGEYVLTVDGYQTKFYVDTYTIKAEYKDWVIEGRIKSYFTKPNYVEFVLSNESMEIEGNATITNGKFTIPVNLTGNCTAILECGNAKLELKFKKEFRVIGKIVAYDAINKSIVVKYKFKKGMANLEDLKVSLFVESYKSKLKKIGSFGDYNFIEIRIPASKDIIEKFGFPLDVLNTKTTVKKLRNDLIRLELNNKLNVWYRFSVKIPEGYKVKEIVGDDCRKIVNSIHLNRTTGEIEGELRWYVEDNTLYFYDDPIWGYNITLQPPQPNRSIAIELAYSGAYSGSGQISAIVFPYSQDDDDATITIHDHAGRTEDNDYGNDIDIDAGSKIAIRYSNRQYGNPYSAGSLGNGNINHINRTDVQLNNVPNGELESVIITKMQTPLWGQRQVNITQKVIIRNNNRWFATVYYIENVGSQTLTNLRFFQGMDWNFRGSFTNDNSYYDSNTDIVYGYDVNAPPSDIQYGGFGSVYQSSQHDVGYYYTIWQRIASNSLTNSNSYSGDAGTALAWDKTTLNPREKWVIPIIWALGFDFNDMVSNINAGKSELYDAGILSIDSPENNSNYNPATAGVVYFNATVALFGIVDLDNLQVIFNVTKEGGGYSYQNSTTVNLSIPYSETVKVSFPLNLSTLSYGKYKVSFRTNLSNDQNTSNDEAWIYINIVSFTVEPDQSATSNPGSEVFYNLSAQNYGSSGRFDVNITQSTKGWTTRLYESGLIIAEDTDGDGTWDYINSSYDTNSNNLPDIFIPYGSSNITISKVIPSSALLGETDFTTLDFVNVSIHDDVTLTTKTPEPPTVQKTFYLHNTLTLNTTKPNLVSSYTQISPNSLQSWQQIPKFADDFNVVGEIRIPLWLSSSTSATHTVAVSLLYTNGLTSYVLGSQTKILSLTTIPTLETFNITLSSQQTIPRDNYFILRIENSKTTATLNVYHDFTHPSRIITNTTTYIRVLSVDENVVESNATIIANITDPIGSYDIVEAKLTVYYPNGTLYIDNATMNLVSTDSNTPSLWKIYNYSFYLPVAGEYNGIVYGIESNGVKSNLTFTVTLGKTIVGRVLEDASPLGINYNEDVGIKNVTVALLKDDGDGVLDFDDKIVGLNKTNESGYYSFEIANTTSVYFIAVDSKTVNTTRGLNANYNSGHIWAEQTYQTEWSGSGWAVVKKFGGQEATKSDVFGVDFEHYIKLNLTNYNGENLDFGFSFDVIVNVKDVKENLKAVGEVFIINASSSWKKVYLRNYYENPVIVCTYNLPSSSNPPAVIRIKDVNSYSFEIKIQNPGDTTTPTSSDIHCIVMEEGNWTLSDGRKVEAHRVLSDGTNENNNWASSLMEQIAYNWSYTNPVVLGQVMSYNDSNWSVFWASDGNRLNPPDSTNLYVGKHVGEDTDTTRNPEILGVIIVEAGSGVVNGIKYEALLGSNSIRGVGNSPPYSYTLNDMYSIGIATQNAMNGGNGGWAILYGSNPVSNTINLAIDEDTIRDSERRHISEQVAYWVFNKSGILTAKIDSNRFCQGCLRQFIVNSNAISGKQRSYFVMQTSPNSQDSNGKWWTVLLNSSLGSLNIRDEVEINGSVLNSDMSINNSNTGFVHYNYETTQLESYSTQVERAVGVGSDGIPFSGDEPKVKAVPKPEIEIYGDSLNPVIDIHASNVIIKNVSIFGSSYNTYPGAVKVENSASNFVAEDVFFGLRANGSDPNDSGLRRTGGANLWIEGNNATIRHSIIAFAERYGLLFYTSNVVSGLVEEVIAYRNAIVFDGGDNMGVESGVSNVTFRKCISAKASANGIESNGALGNIQIHNCSIEHNNIGNESGFISETAGIRINSNNSVVSNSLIRNNVIGVLISNRLDDTTTKQLFNVTLTKNSIYNNSKLGIDLADGSDFEIAFSGDNVTLNDGMLNASQPNYGVDYPVITYAQLNGSKLYVEGFIGNESVGASQVFSNAIVEIYLVKNANGGDNLVGNNVSSSVLDNYYGEGWIYLGNITSDSNGRFSGSVDVPVSVDSNSVITATTTLNGNTSEFGPNYQFKPYRNVSASIEVVWLENHYNVMINVTAYTKTQYGVTAYWIEPDGMVVNSMSGDYNASGNNSNLFWWRFDVIQAGETKHIYLNLTASNDCSIKDAYIVGVDPN